MLYFITSKSVIGADESLECMENWTLLCNVYSLWCQVVMSTLSGYSNHFVHFGWGWDLDVDYTIVQYNSQSISCCKMASVYVGWKGAFCLASVERERERERVPTQWELSQPMRWSMISLRRGQKSYHVMKAISWPKSVRSGSMNTIRSMRLGLIMWHPFWPCRKYERW